MRVVSAAIMLAGSIYAADSQSTKKNIYVDTTAVLGFNYDQGPGYFRPVRNFGIQFCPVPLMVAFDSLSRAIVVSSKQRTYRLYDRDENQTQELIGHSGDAGLTFSEPGVLCLASREGKLHRLAADLKSATHAGPLFCMAVTKDKLFLGTVNDTITCASNDSFWGSAKTRYAGTASGWVNALEVVDNKLISGNYTGEVTLIDIETSNRTVLGNHDGHPVTAFAKFGSIVYSGASFAASQNVENNTPTTTSTISTGSSSSTAPSNSLSDAAEIKVWDIRAARPLCMSVTGFGDSIGVNAMVSLSKGYLAVGRKKGMITLYDMRTLQAAETLCTRHGENYGSVTALTTTDDGGIISTNSNGLIQVWKEKQ